MIYELILYTLKDGTEPALVDDLMRRARSLLLRIPQVLAVKSGKALQAGETSMPAQGAPLGPAVTAKKGKATPVVAASFFVSVEYDSLAKREIAHDDPLWMKYQLEVVQAHTKHQQEFIFELEPGKNVKYS